MYFRKCKKESYYIASERPHLSAPPQILTEADLTVPGVELQTDCWNKINGFIRHLYLGTKWNCIRSNFISQPIYSLNKFVEQQH